MIGNGDKKKISMKKRFLGIIIVNIFCFLLFPESFSLTLDGNAHIFSYNDLKRLHEMNPAKYSADGLYRSYDNLRKSCGNNEILFDEKCKTEFANQLITIIGHVKQVRKSILDEYIVELEANETWAWNVSVVYPKRISQKMKGELMQLRQGDYFEALAITRSTYMYVDVPVWNSNGTYRTEP